MNDRANDWYSARLIFRSRIDGVVLDDALYEERVVLLRAESVDDARAQAHSYAAKEGFEYPNEHGETITWELHSVNDVGLVVTPQDESGWEVWSRLLRRDELVAPAEGEGDGPR